MMHCPNCGYTFETPPSAPAGARAPEDGDFMLCLGCGDIARFDAKLRRAVATTEQELAGLPRLSVTQLAIRRVLAK